MGRAHEVRAASMAKTAAIKSKLYSRYGKELYIAAKAGVPDPEMNLTLKRKISEAKAAQVPADVIKRAIEKAKGNSTDNYDSLRYEGFGPGASTIIIDCLTDNPNRTIAGINTCFNKSKCKLGVKGSVSFNYDNLGILTFKFDDEEKILDILIEADVNVSDVENEDGLITVYVEPTDLHKAEEAITSALGETNFEELSIKMLAQEYVSIDNPEEKELWDRLLTMLNDFDDVNEIFHNVKD
ncbi:MAG: YebC/PmpR family DNA-binding transcriptional regulator [Erysipelotrichaceae bacterium]|nr:YebC/PmpR family DNA-binding transcriptional regulator [Erysipelotrichaceae bacterium]